MILDRITIKNFKSLRNVTVDLQRVNLFVGPNNSGKSNFFRALDFFRGLMRHPSIAKDDGGLNNISYQKGPITLSKNNYHPIKFRFDWQDPEETGIYFTYQLEIYKQSEINNNTRYKISYSQFLARSTNRLKQINFLYDLDYLIDNVAECRVMYDFENAARCRKTISRTKVATISKFKEDNSVYFHTNENGNEVERLMYFPGLNGFISDDEHIKFGIELNERSFIQEICNNLNVYNPQPSYLTKLSHLQNTNYVSYNAENIIPFLDNLRDDHPEVFQEIENDLSSIIPEFNKITFPKVFPDVNIYNGQKEVTKRLKLTSRDGIGYWADELSEGVLYLICLLAIVHQPISPKLLLLEEPENGIHPRRIKEVIELIYKLAELKDIQVIFTSHSPVVLDNFKDDTDAVFIFDKIEGETKIKNLKKHVIKDLAKKKLSPQEIKSSLGEHWLMGFFGGVPDAD